VELQRVGDLTDAAAKFRDALRFNTNNIAAQLNLALNNDLSIGRRVSANPSTIANNPQIDLNNPSGLLKEDGPIDDPAFCFLYGYTLASVNNFYRQAVAPLKRACELDPDFVPARIWLARVYGMNHMPDKMFDVLNAPIRQTDESSPADSHELAMLLSAAYFQKNDLTNGVRLLEMEISRDPTNQNLLATVGKIYLNRGLFSNALAVVNMQSRLTPDDPSRLLIKGYIYNQLKQYDQAIATLNRALAVQKEDDSVTFQLANAYFGEGNLEAARANFEKLQQSRTNSPQLAFGLEEIAWRQHDTNEAIRNIEIFLTHGSTNSPQAQLMQEHYRQLKQ
jgi:tetratricopeptide (TPR) repeat protein